MNRDAQILVRLTREGMDACAAALWRWTPLYRWAMRGRGWRYRLACACWAEAWTRYERAAGRA